MPTDVSADLRLLLNGEWEFAAAEDGDRPTAGWTRVRVPHRSREFEDQPPSSGWYRGRLPVPEDWDVGPRRVILDLGRVRHYGRAYLDGEPLGEHRGMRLPWHLDLTQRVAPGTDHELTVYTHSCRGRYAHADATQLSEEAEKALDTRFWYTSAATVGMESDVWLRLESRLRIEDVQVITSVREHRLRALLTVRNDSETSFQGDVALRVRRDGGTQLELPRCPVEVPAGQSRRVEVATDWEDAVIWGRPPYGEPVLYFLEASLEGAGEAIHTEITRFGFREVWTEGDRLLLNGVPLFPWGDHTMPYVYERQWLTRKFIDLAEANISIVEHHRYDPPPVFHDVADELGVFVVGANFCVGTGQVVPADMDTAERSLVMEHHLAVTDHWIRAARNHPSILFWDITDARDPTYCVPLMRRVKQLDTTRVVEVTFDPAQADEELIELIDCYRLFSGLDSIEASIETIRAELPVKPIRVGEAGIFEGAQWGEEDPPPLQEGFAEFLESMPARNIHGLQTFHLADMDYHGFTHQVPGMLVGPLEMRVSWPSQSGTDARIDPFGEGGPVAWGKHRLCLNWCDPGQPVSRLTATARWSRQLFRRLTGRDVGPLAAERVPEILVRVRAAGRPVAGAVVVAAPTQGQAVAPFGIRADHSGTAWLVVPEPGLYRISCAGSSVEVETSRQPIRAPAGYDHLHVVDLDVVDPE